MATNNPFYVDPGNDFSTGLSGLSGTLSNIRQDRVQAAEIKKRDDAIAAQRQRQEEATQAAQQAYQTGDPDMMAKVSLQYPEIAQNLHQVVGLNDERKVKEAAGFARDLLLASPEQREGIFKQRIQSLQDQQRDPTHTYQAYQQYLQDPNGAMQGIELDWAAGDPNGYKVVADKERARAKAELEQAKMDREDMRFERAEAGRNSRAAARATREGASGSMLKPTAGMQDYQFYQQLKRENPEGAQEFGRQRGFVSKEGQELSVNMQKRLSDAGDEALKSEGNVARYTELADQVEKAPIRGGVLGNWQEVYKETTGDQDAVSNLRQRFNGIKASQVVNNLPPGAASDTDIKLALSGFPSDKANKQQITSFLRGLSKLEQKSAEYNNFKSDWITDKGTERGMLQAWKERGKPTSKQASQPASTQQPAAAPAPAAGGWRIVP